MARIVIRADDVRDLGHGFFEIDLQTQNPTAEELKILDRLFPNLLDRVFQVLTQEALLESIAHPGDIPYNEVSPTIKGKTKST